VAATLSRAESRGEPRRRRTCLLLEARLPLASRDTGLLAATFAALVQR
jgi:hypothetical protein